MKTKFTLLAFMLILFTSAGFSQVIANGGFESWDGNGLPVSWHSLDETVAGFGATEVWTTQETTPANVHGGASSLKLQTVLASSFLQSPTLLPGFVSQGNVIYNGSGFLLGEVPYTYQPDTISLWYKYTQGNNTGALDVGLLKFSLTKGTGRTNVGGLNYSQALTFDTTSTWTNYVLPAKKPGAMPPDSLLLGFLSSNPNGSAKAGSTLWVDDVVFKFGATSTNDLELNVTTLMSIFPVPSNAIINVKVSETMLDNTYSIINLGGQVIKTGTIEQLNSLYDVSDFAGGNYIFMVYDKNNKSVNQARFIVAK